MARRTKSDNPLGDLGDNNDLMTALERILGNMPSTLSEMQAQRPQAAAPQPAPGAASGSPNLAGLLGMGAPPAGMGFIDPRSISANPSMIPPHSGNVVQWLGGAMEPNKYENLLAGIAAANNILTSMDLAKRQKKQTEMMADLSDEDAQKLLFLSLLQGGFGGGR